jgi:thymidylate synthase (FAD)
MSFAQISILDHGYIRLVESWGRGDANKPEAGIVEAARQSTQGSFRGWEKDEKLLQHLYTQDPKHAGPFEFAGMTIEIQAPIMVFREWHRHRTQSYNEMSARYEPLPDVHYLPTAERCVVTPGSNKQANPIAGTPQITPVDAQLWLLELQKLFYQSQRVYKLGLEAGIPKEIARGATTVFRYSRMRASANLRNWLAFLTLRMHPNAQWEIRQYADAAGLIVSQQFPRTWALFNAEV